MRTTKHEEHGHVVRVTMVAEEERNGIWCTLYTDGAEFYTQVFDGSDGIQSINAENEEEALAYFDEWKEEQFKLFGGDDDDE